MTRNLSVFGAGTEFGLWMRGNLRDSKKEGNGLSITDLDFVVYVVDNYDTHSFMLIEEKTRGGKVNEGQRKTMLLLDRVCSFGAKKWGYDYLGCHCIVMSHTTPDNSTSITLDGKEVDRESLIRFLNTSKTP